MSVEYQVPTPLVPIRKNLFLRYCKKHPIHGIWIVVDISLDRLCSSSDIKCHRRPSGCVIQEMPEKKLKVIWIEHVEVDDTSIHGMFKQIVNSGMAFGAMRWVATLNRQCDRLTTVMANSNSYGTQNMLKLAERMVTNYCVGVTGSSAYGWNSVPVNDDNDVRVALRMTVDDPGKPLGILLNASSSFWLPYFPKVIFDFFLDESSRSKWDILSNDGRVQKVAQITTGKEHGNYVSLLHVNQLNSMTNKNKELMIIQESYSDATGSYLIYAPVDIGLINKLLNGGDPDGVKILSLGFAIIPDVTSGLATGSLLTVSFQNHVTCSRQSLELSHGSLAAKLKTLVTATVDKIKNVLLNNSP